MLRSFLFKYRKIRGDSWIRLNNQNIKDALALPPPVALLRGQNTAPKDRRAPRVFVALVIVLNPRKLSVFCK